MRKFTFNIESENKIIIFDGGLDLLRGTTVSFLSMPI